MPDHFVPDRNGPSRARQILVRDGVGKFQFCKGLRCAFHAAKSILTPDKTARGLFGGGKFRVDSGGDILDGD